jgi:hypothetical protein
VKFSRVLLPGSLDYLNMRLKIKAAGCPHCRHPSSVLSHGFLQAASGDDKRGMRFFCSARGSNKGCGRTFSVLWNAVIPRCSLLPGQILTLVRAVAHRPSIHGAWYFGRFSFSLSSAYRWIAKWLELTSHIRTALCAKIPPPGKADSLPDPYTLHHLSAAFPKALCAIAAFQLDLQTAING